MASLPSFRLVLVACAAAASASLAGCGGTVTCGTGTRLEEGVCVAETLATCPAGQALRNGACVAVCGAGTIATDATCVPSAEACGAGTELVGGTCKLVDPLAKVTVKEATEPNEEAAKAARFGIAADVPATYLGGSIGAAHDSAADFDSFVFTAAAGQRIRVEAIPVGAPSIAVVLHPVADPTRFVRYVADLSGRGASRDLLLPVGGDWLLTVSESSNFEPLGGGRPRGGEGFTYAVAVGALPAQSSTSLALPGTASGGLVNGVTYDLANNGSTPQIVELSLAPASDLPFNGVRALWATTPAGEPLFETTDRTDALGTLVPMGISRVVVPPGGIRIGVDHVVDLGGAANGFLLTTAIAKVEEVTLPLVDGAGDLAPAGSQVFSFEVAQNVAGILAVEASEIGADAYGDFELTLLDASFNAIATSSGNSSAALGVYLGAGAARRYFVVCTDRAFSPEDLDLTFKLNIALGDVTALGPIASPGTASVTATLTGATTPAAYFAITATTDSVIRLEAVDAGVSGNDLRIAVLGPDLRETISSGYSTTTDPSVEGVLATAGKAVIVVVTGDAAGDVSLTATADSLTSRTVAAGVQPASETGNIAVNTQVDYYKVTVPFPSTLHVETSSGPSGGSPDTYLALYDLTGARLAYDDDGGVDIFSVIDQPVAAGTYYVAVSISPYAFGADTGDYTVAFSTAP